MDIPTKLKQPLAADEIGALMCPCGHNYLHFYEIRPYDAPAGEWSGKGIRLSYSCECCGHVTHEERTFHKGMTLIKVWYDTSINIHEEMIAHAIAAGHLPSPMGSQDGGTNE